MEGEAGRELVHDGLDGQAKRNRADEKRKQGSPQTFPLSYLLHVLRRPWGSDTMSAPAQTTDQALQCA